MIKQEITCDHCKRDLSSTGNSIDYAITVKNRSLPSVGGSVTNMMIYPQLENDLDFCGLGCLKKYFLEMSK